MGFAGLKVVIQKNLNFQKKIIIANYIQIIHIPIDINAFTARKALIWETKLPMFL